MSSNCSEDALNHGPNTERTPLLAFLRDAPSPTSEADDGSSSHDDSTSLDGSESTIAVASGVVDVVALGLDAGPEQISNLRKTGYGSVNESNGSGQESVDDLTLPSGRSTDTDDAPSKYIGVSTGRFWVIFSGILAVFAVSPMIRAIYSEN